MELVVDQLYLQQPLTYCPRKSRLATQGWLPIAKNNALLLSSGAVIVRFNTPVGTSEHLLMEPITIVTYRSGPKLHSYWYEDLGLELAIANRYGGGVVHTGTLYWERNHTIYTHAPVLPREDLLDEALDKYPDGRLSKSTARAISSCRFCPGKHACDALDRELGTTTDWSPNYPFP